MAEMMMVKQGGLWFPFSDDDREKNRKYRQGKVVKMTVVRQSDRSIQHHRLYFGGLLELAMDYWEPDAGCLSPNEEAILKAFTRFLAKGAGLDKDALETVREGFTARLRAKRAETHNAPQKNKEDLHRWVKEEMGLYDLVLTPAGWVKKVRSINFNAMPSEAEFMEFYNKAFSVIWKFILSRKFDSEAEAQSAIDRLLEMG